MYFKNYVIQILNNNYSFVFNQLDNIFNEFEHHGFDDTHA